MSRGRIAYSSLMGIVLVFCFAYAPNVRGATVLCDFENRFQELKNIEENTALPAQKKAAAELNKRKEILADIIGCSIKEIRGAQELFSAIPLPENDRLVGSARRWQLEQLDGAIAYYESHIPKIEESTIFGIKRIAKDIAEWRAAIYAPLAEKTTYFTIWLKNQDILRAANARFSQITAIIHNLKLQDEENIAELLRAARESLLGAERDNNASRQLFTDPNAPANSFSIVKSSLEKLSEAYRNFFAVSEAVNEVLPH